LPRDDFRTITEELQLQGDTLGKKLQYTVGGFYFDQKPIGVQGGDAIVFCPAAFTGFCSADDSTSGVRQKSKALYAQGTLDFGVFAPALAGLRLIGGYRHTWDTIQGFSTRFSPNTALPGQSICSSTGTSVPTGTARTACRFDSTLKTNAGTWTTGLDYRVSSDLMLFGKISRGYKAGGFNPYAVFVNTRTFEPEFVTDYELGFKSNYRIGTVATRLNATVFNLDYKDIQRSTGDYNIISNASGAKTVNADARIRGIELDASVRPIPELELGGTFSYTDAKYTEYSFIVNGFFPQTSCNGPVNPGSRATMTCLPFQYVSPYIFSVHAGLDVPLSGNGTLLSIFANYSHSASQYTDATQLETVQPGARIGAFGLLNLSVDVKNIAGSGFDIGVYATNLTNELYRTSNTDVYQPGGLLYWSTLYGEPRMYGLRLKYSFGS
jgi:iron complex outermembrane receptor protein